MDLNHLRVGVTIAFGMIVLSGCGGVDPVQPDQNVALQPGYGIAAVGFDTLDPLNAIDLRSADPNGVQLGVSFVDKGSHLFVFAVPAGSYCLRSFHTGFYKFWTIDSHDDCFDVVAGKVAYSGNYTPRAYGKSVQTPQMYDWAAFEKTFKDQYPKLASLPIVTP